MTAWSADGLPTEPVGSLPRPTRLQRVRAGPEELAHRGADAQAGRVFLDHDELPGDLVGEEGLHALLLCVGLRRR